MVNQGEMIVHSQEGWQREICRHVTTFNHWGGGGGGRQACCALQRGGGGAGGQQAYLVAAGLYRLPLSAICMWLLAAVKGGWSEIHLYR